ncbi:MAG: ABC transporter substrate-binding protein [Patescibacteria group bacterium]
MYKKLRFAARLTTALFTKYYLAIILGLVLGIASFIGLPPLLARLPYIRPTITTALVGRFTEKELPNTVLQKMSIGLTTIGESGVPAPGLAQSWEATDSGKVYIFTLSPDLRWHDGTSVKSSDISLNFKDAEVEIRDDTHLQIKLQNPFAPLASIVARPLFKSEKNSRLVGVGSYKLRSVRKNGSFVESIILAPIEKDSKLPLLKYNFYATQSQARTAFKLGLVQIVSSVSETGDLASWPNLEVANQVAIDRHVVLFFDTSGDLFSGASGKNLRLALNYAIDKSRYQARSIGPLSSSSWAFNNTIRKYDFDLKRAKDLFSKVEKQPEEIDLVTLPIYEQAANQIKTDWEALGLKVNIKVNQDIPDKYEALLVAQVIPTDPDQYNFWHSTQTGTNLSRFNNPRIDKLLEDGRKTLDLTERKKLYADFQRFLLDESPAVFLYFPETYTITKK